MHLKKLFLNACCVTSSARQLSAESRMSRHRRPRRICTRCV